MSKEELRYPVCGVRRSEVHDLDDRSQSRGSSQRRHFVLPLIRPTSCGILFKMKGPEYLCFLRKDNLYYSVKVKARLMVVKMLRDSVPECCGGPVHESRGLHSGSRDWEAGAHGIRILKMR